MTGAESQGLEAIANALDEISESLYATTNVPFGTRTRLKECVRWLCQIARNNPRETTGSHSDGSTQGNNEAPTGGAPRG
jgi:hypothetical protein